MGTNTRSEITTLARARPWAGRRLRRGKLFFRGQSDSSLIVGRIVDPRPGLRELSIRETSSVPGPHGRNRVAEGPGENQYRNFGGLVVCRK
jgi:hypothetical protein